MFNRAIHFLSSRSPWLVYLPFFLLFAYIAVSFSDHSQLYRDEYRYWGFAENLLNGHFHFKTGDNFLWSGPGYPITMVPFVAFDAHLAVIKFMNAVYLYLSVVLLFKTFTFYFSRRTSFLLALAWACYFPFYEFALPEIMTEALAALMVTATMYTWARAFRTGRSSWRQLLLPGFCLAFLVLTKIIFGYVVVFVGAVVWIARLIRRKNPPTQLLPLSRVMALALAFLLPYLVYTFTLTGRPLYWGNTGGLSLYWMASPFEDELGDWHGPSLREHPQLMQNHGEFFAEIKNLPPIEKDDALKARAVQHIKAHPKKFVYNAIANVGRTFFSYPLSFLKPSNGIYKYLIVHGFLLVMTFLMLPLTIRRHQRFPAEMLLMLGIVLVYLGETVLVASYVRFFCIVVPVFVWWIAYGWDRFVSIGFKPDRDDGGGGGK